MQEKDIDEIIRVVLTGEASEKERTLLQEWLAASEENRQVFQQLQFIWAERDPEPQLAHAPEISEQIWNKATQKQARRLPFLPTPGTSPYAIYWKVAAMVLLVVGLPVLYFLYTAAGDGAIAEVYTVEKKSALGQKVKITLPDGSLAWLNADSKIQYAHQFEGNTRTVVLEGEGYFEVKKDPHKPFIVQAGGVSTVAVGTSFNIRFYPEDSSIQVALVTGKVQVHSPQATSSEAAYQLTEGYGVNYNKYSRQSTRYQFNKQEVIAWKQGILIFEGDSFEEVTNKIRRWYGVEVVVSGIPPTDWELTGKFKNEPLASVLENIRFGRNFRYQISGKQLNLYFEPTKP